MTTEMRIEIEKRLFHFRQPAGTSRGTYTTRTSWMLRATDGSLPGRVGVGECAPLPKLSCDDIPDYEQVLRGMCDVVERNGEIPYALLRPYPSMLFGLETALLGLRNGGVLFDTPFTRGEEGITINGLVWMGSFEEMRRRMEEKIDQGFGCVKLKIGAIDFDSELALVRSLRQRFSSQVMTLRVDANGAFSPLDAMDKLRQLAPYDIHSIEQPIRQRQWHEMERLCKTTPIPIALDEELIGVNSPEMKNDLLDTIRPQYIILKPSLHGGMRGSEEWIALARQKGIGSWITSALESNVGLNAIAQFTARVYPGGLQAPQGLGTGQLFTDNIESPLHIEGDQLWYNPDFLADSH